MEENKNFSNETLQHLLSIPDPLAAGTLGDIAVRLRDAPLASVFALSRKAHSSEIRSEAEQAVNARLREDDPANPESSPHADAVARGELPPEVATVRHFYKFREGEQWVLTTRSGIRVAAFPSEADLDHWWRGLKKQRGRIITRGKKGKS